MFEPSTTRTMSGEFGASILADSFVQDVAVGSAAAVLPSGTVTFLLTHVKVSTLLWE
jgi:hypothetical protein